MGNRTIVVYEHTRLHIGEQDFTPDDFKALIKYNDLHGNKYFTIGYNKIIFKSYVGVIQVGNKVIEVLPKADSLPETSEMTKTKWQNALLYMLKKAGYIKLNETEKASQQTNKTHLLNIYLHAFLKEIEALLHAGLIKKYRRVKENQTALKGKLLIEQQVRVNFIHKEFFFTEHNVYDKNNQFNKILKKALEIIRSSSTNATIKRNANGHLFQFEHIDSWQGKDNEFDKLTYDRKTKPYTYAIELARMVISNYCPDMTTGNKSVLAVLFDMNRLFEKFIYSELKKQEKNYTSYSLNISQQKSVSFWKNKVIKPDIIVSIKTKEDIKLLIVDTKWKIIRDGMPSDDDLKQLFTYNIQFGAFHSILFYPVAGFSNKGRAKFTESPFFPSVSHHCEMYFAQLFNPDGISINESFSHLFIEYLLKNLAL